MSTPDVILSRDKWAAEYLKKVVGAILLEVGFDSAEKGAFAKLVALLEQFLVKLCRSTKAFGEVASRSQPMVNDVVRAAIEVGMNVESLIAYGQRPCRVLLPVPPSPLPSLKLKPLNLYTRLPRPSYIPEHLPEFPDAHCYIRTPVHAGPITGYENVREHNAVQKRNMLKAVTSLEATMSHMETNLFPDDPCSFLLISSKPKANHYYDILDHLSFNSKENKDPVTGRSQQQRKSNGQVSIDHSDLNADTVINNPYLYAAKVTQPIKAMKSSQQIQCDNSFYNSVGPYSRLTNSTHPQ